MIKLCLSEENFEYDIRGLLMAFYPGETIMAQICQYQDDREIQSEAYADKELLVNYAGREIYLEYRVNEDGRKTFIRTEKIAVDPKERKETKSSLKRAVYRLLLAHTGKELPWGTLTGIRPTKIPMAMLEEGKTEQEIACYMQSAYLISKEKTDLSIAIAKREKDILKNIDYRDGYSLYIGIPFCPTTCLYCSFTSYPMAKWAGRMDEYLEALFKEIDYTAEAFKDKKLNTVYIGGGTPTSLSAEQLDRLLTKIEQSFCLVSVQGASVHRGPGALYLQEFTVEAGRPDSITKEKLEALKKHMVTRISINPQTMKQETLKLIGRHHTVEQIKEVYQTARELGFNNINMDLILGLPNEDIEDVRHTMEELIAMNPDNITVHSLAVKRAARLNMFKEQYENLHMENTEEMMALTSEYCHRIGLEPYYLYRQKNMAGNLENVGYTKPGKAGVYNILIMEEKQTIVALGAGSTTKAVYPGDRIERADNVKDVEQYLERIDEMIERKKKLFGR